MLRSTSANTPRADLYQEVTDQIIALLETGCRPWTPRWAAGAMSLPLRHTGEAYKGINVLLLWAQAMSAGYRNPVWMTFKQALALGGCVRKGERGSMVVYAGTLAGKDEESETSPDAAERRSIAFLKRYTVFNVEQIDGLPQDLYPTPAPVLQNRDGRDPELDRRFAAYGVPVRELDGGAYYQPAADTITMPLFESFVSGNAFYATLAHEAIHSTGHASRLDRETLRRYGESIGTRAKEELIAEIGAAMLCAALGMEPTEREDHASYVESWLKALKNDKRAIFQAASAAQAASDYILTAMAEDTAARAAA